MTINRIELIKQKLQAAFSPSRLEVIDDSHLHIGHVGAQGGAGHFTVKIVGDSFANKSKLKCHRLIYAALADMMPADIHALKILVAAE